MSVESKCVEASVLICLEKKSLAKLLWKSLLFFQMKSNQIKGNRSDSPASADWIGGGPHYRKPAICRVPRLCRVYFIGHSANTVFAECQIKYTRQTKTHGKIRLCRVFFSGTRQRSFLPCAFFFALGKSFFRSNF